MEKTQYPSGVPTKPEAGIPANKTGKAFELGDFREAKLFISKDRATLTFFLKQEVASIHFDKSRNEIFFKGHNVKNMTLAPEQWQSLQKFSEYLIKENADPEFIQSYQKCLSHIPPPL